MKFATLALSALFLVSLATAQPPAPEKRVTAQGTGEINVAPDMATFSVEVVNNDDSPTDAAIDTRKDMATVLAATRRFVRNPADLKTTRLAINPVYEWVEGKRKFRGYDASQTVEITVRDLSKIDSLLGDVSRSELSTLGNLEFHHSKADTLTREALLFATRNARDNATRICESVGLVCDEILSVRMQGTGGSEGAPMMFRMAKDAGNGIPVQPGMLTFRATVEADFKIK